MATTLHNPNKRDYLFAAALLVLALLFPVGLMIFDPTLMFERGWEQYVGTAIYFWAVITLAGELQRLWKNESAFDLAPALLAEIDASTKSSATPDTSTAERRISQDDGRVLPIRVRQLVAYLEESRNPSISQVMEIHREGSGLDQEQMAGRFTLTRYILYLLPVIGFIGTVEGISKALMNISKVLPMVKNLDGFMSNLTSVTGALQIAFDSTLLALFLSASLMLVQTLVFRRSEDLLAKIDRWIVEHVLPRIGDENPIIERLAEIVGPRLDAMGDKLGRVLEPSARALELQAEKLGESLRVPISLFAAEVQQLPHALASFTQGAEAIGRLAPNLAAIGSAADSFRQGMASISRIETTLAQLPSHDTQLEEIKQGIERAGIAIDSLAGSFSAAYERANRSTQEQLARSLDSLKDALELLNVSMEQGNILYRSIVKKTFDERGDSQSSRADGIRVA